MSSLQRAFTPANPRPFGLVDYLLWEKKGVGKQNPRRTSGDNSVETPVKIGINNANTIMACAGCLESALLDSWVSQGAGSGDAARACGCCAKRLIQVGAVATQRLPQGAAHGRPRQQPPLRFPRPACLPNSIIPAQYAHSRSFPISPSHILPHPPLMCETHARENVQKLQDLSESKPLSCQNLRRKPWIHQRMHACVRTRSSTHA